MHWSRAVRLAMRCDDISEEEWNNLYVSYHAPTQEQIDRASEVAHKILVRNQSIYSDVLIDTDGGWDS